MKKNVLMAFLVNSFFIASVFANQKERETSPTVRPSQFPHTDKSLLTVVTNGVTNVIVVSSAASTNGSLLNQPSHKEAKLFEFKGGNLGQFLDAIKDNYGVNYIEIADIPYSSFRKVRVPKIKEYASASGILITYNLLSKAGVKGLGKWVAPMLRPDVVPTTLVFVPPEDADLEPSVRVFPLTSYQAADLDSLQQAVAVAINVYSRNSGVTPNGDLNFHEKTRTLIAVGDEQYVTIVSEVVNGFKEASKYLKVVPAQPDGGKQPEKK